MKAERTFAELLGQGIACVGHAEAHPAANLSFVERAHDPIAPQRAEHLRFPRNALVVLG